MKFIGNLALLLLSFLMISGQGQAAVGGPDVVPENNIIAAEAAYDLVWQALDIMGKDPVKRIVITGDDIVNNEQVVLLSAGNDSEDGSKYTAFYHFAVSAGGRVYYMDPARGSAWVLLKNISSRDTAVVQQGMYSRSDSTELSSGVLTLKTLDEGMLLFELRLYDRGKSLLLSGVVNIEQNNTAVYDAAVNDSGEFKLNFTFDTKGQSVKVAHEGTVAVRPDGEYILVNKSIGVKAATAVILLEELPTALTSLNGANRPYSLYEAQNTDNTVAGRIIIEARNVTSDTVFARFSVAEDLSNIYRIDPDMQEPILIFGSGEK